MRSLNLTPHLRLCCTKQSWHFSAAVMEFGGLGVLLRDGQPSGPEFWLHTRVASGSFKKMKKKKGAKRKKAEAGHPKLLTQLCQAALDTSTVPTGSHGGNH